MLDYLEYLPGILTLIGGALAFFYAKSGKKDEVGGVGWIMATIFVLGGLVSIYVLYLKKVETEQANAVAREESAKAVAAAAKQSALVMTLIGDFDLKQNIKSAQFYFEYKNDADSGKPVPPAAGFIGPLPLLPKGVEGVLDILISDSVDTSFAFAAIDGETLSLHSEYPKQDYTLQTGSITASDGKTASSETGELIWVAQQEMAPGGFVYALTVPLNVPLRRLIYKIASQEPLGYIRFPKGSLSETQLQSFEAGFAQHPPEIMIFIPEIHSKLECDSYARVPLRIVRTKEPLHWDKEFDAFALQLTDQGFFSDPCDNDPT